MEFNCTTFKNDDTKMLLDPSNTHRVRDLIKKN